jgi:hypothetical protein
MKSAFFLALALLTCFSISAQAQTRSSKMKYRVYEDSYSNSVSTDRPNAVSVELAGRGIGWGINYDRSLNESFGVGIGYSNYELTSHFYLAGTSITRRSNVTIIPFYGNFYFQPHRHRGFLSAGASLAKVDQEVGWGTHNRNALSFADSGFIPTIGGGYEFRAVSGFLFRASIYSFLARNTMVWPGLTFGGTF